MSHLTCEIVSCIHVSCRIFYNDFLFIYFLLFYIVNCLFSFSVFMILVCFCSVLTWGGMIRHVRHYSIWYWNICADQMNFYCNKYDNYVLGNWIAFWRILSPFFIPFICFISILFLYALISYLYSGHDSLFTCFCFVYETASLCHPYSAIFF